MRAIANAARAHGMLMAYQEGEMYHLFVQPNEDDDFEYAATYSDLKAAYDALPEDRWIATLYAVNPDGTLTRYAEYSTPVQWVDDDRRIDRFGWQIVGGEFVEMDRRYMRKKRVDDALYLSLPYNDESYKAKILIPGGDPANLRADGTALWNAEVNFGSATWSMRAAWAASWTEGEPFDE